MKIQDTLFGMGGWKTWAAVAGLALLAMVDAANGDFDAAGAKIMAALGLVGLGHKIEKNKGD